MDKTVKVLYWLLKAKPTFNNKEEEEDWKKKISDFCEISGIFEKTYLSKKFIDAECTINNA